MAILPTAITHRDKSNTHGIPFSGSIKKRRDLNLPVKCGNRSRRHGHAMLSNSDSLREINKLDDFPVTYPENHWKLEKEFFKRKIRSLNEIVTNKIMASAPKKQCSSY